MRRQQFIFGLGTGRCGTTSLATLLNRQADTSFTHEMGREMRLPWVVDRARFDQYVAKIEGRPEPFVGDCAFYLLPYAELLVERFPGCRFVIMVRKKAETIRSYLDWTQGRHHWTKHNGVYWHPDRVWDQCYPNYSEASKEQCLSAYYDEYYDQCRRLETHRCIWVHLNRFNDRQQQSELLAFCGLDRPRYFIVQENARH